MRACCSCCVLCPSSELCSSTLFAVGVVCYLFCASQHHELRAGMLVNQKNSGGYLIVARRVCKVTLTDMLAEIGERRAGDAGRRGARCPHDA